MNQNETNHLKRTVDWKQGFAIALGVPLLILPSIGYFTGYAWSASILIWFISVVQGFFQNIAYGEMATMLPDASGLPGYAQKVFHKGEKKYEWGDFIGGFSAWSYWFAWAPVMAIFSLLIGGYLKEIFPLLKNYADSLVAGAAALIIFTALYFVNQKGLKNGAILGYLLAGLALIPLIMIVIAAVVSGNFHYENISSHFFPKHFDMNGKGVLIIIGLFAMAQWSACAWETAAVYGPEYKNPKSDIMKSLFACGIVCLFTFVGIQAVCIGVIGVDGVAQNPNAPLVLVAGKIFGSVGAAVSVVALIASMILIIQTAFLGSSRAIHSMAKENNLPSIFGKTNKHGVPVFAMFTIGILNIFLIGLKTPSAIVAASSIGYIFANGISLFAYYKLKSKMKTEPNHQFHAPSFYKYIAGFCGLINIPVFLCGIIYLNSIDLGWRSSLIGFAVLGVYIPLWFATKRGKRFVKLASMTENT
jgi:amino acid transporter